MDDRANLDNIIRLYSEVTYVQVYGGQIAWVIFLTILDLVLLVYYFLKKNETSLKENWTEVRCNWDILPIAGFINKPANKTIIEYTQENYDYCTKQSIESSMSSHFEKPFQTQQKINDMITQSNNLLAKNVAITNQSNTGVNENINSGTNIIYEIFNLLYVGFTLFMNTLMKLTEILKTITYFGMTGITWGTVFFKLIISAVISLLAILFTATVIPAIPFYWLIFPLIFPLTFAFLLVISSSFKNTVSIITDQFAKVEPFTQMNQPKLNLCFGENTRIKTNKGYKKIKHVKVGDVLNGSHVTATFKTLVTPVFNLNGIIVSGEHYVKYNHWIKVKDHPLSVPTDYKGKYLYCLNTTSKTITVGGHEFLDWDELIPEKMNHVLKFYKTPESIHLYDDGFSSLMVKTKRGYKDISEINPDDVLEDARVIATVSLKDKYHIVTDTGCFNGYKDYNYNIDKLFYLN